MVTMLVVLIFLCVFFATAFIVNKLEKIFSAYESMRPEVDKSSNIELTADQFIKFYELFPDNFQISDRNHLIYISDESYEEYDKMARVVDAYIFPDFQYIKLKKASDYYKVYNYLMQEKKREKNREQYATQEKFIKEMRKKTAFEVEKANKTIKTAEDVFKTILNQTEKS